MLQFYNTKTRRVDEFHPLSEGEILLYTCGPTVYNYLHVGNWVAYIRWDILVRTLMASGYDVKRVMNITDVGHLVSDADDGEDKMEKGARREGKTAWEVAKVYTDDFLRGMEELNLISPTYITKATDYIDQQLELVRTLKDKGYTYQISDGIYFDTSKFKTYADFARLDLAGEEAGARVEFNPEKRNSSDFALWKFSPSGEKRDMEWDTPLDLLDTKNPKKGFPGWHLECSAMAMDKLGKTIDIHTGGIDHIPVHHTNEIAQSEAATGKPFAHYWLHNNFLLVDGTKVSKSLGNTYELKDLRNKGFTPQDFRMFVLQSHYATESNFTWENLQAAKNRLRHWKDTADLIWQVKDFESGPIGDSIIKACEDIKQCLYNNLDTPGALKVIEQTMALIEWSYVTSNDKNQIIQFFSDIDSLLGIKVIGEDISKQQKSLIDLREQARKDERWRDSDELRNELLKQGVKIKDTQYGPIWSRL